MIKYVYEIPKFWMSIFCLLTIIMPTCDCVHEKKRKKMVLRYNKIILGINFKKESYRSVFCHKINSSYSFMYLYIWCLVLNNAIKDISIYFVARDAKK